jgi:hypothetical protein
MLNWFPVNLVRVKWLNGRTRNDYLKWVRLNLVYCRTQQLFIETISLIWLCVETRNDYLNWVRLKLVYCRTQQLFIEMNFLNLAHCGDQKLLISCMEIYCNGARYDDNDDNDACTNPFIHTFTTYLFLPINTDR